VRRENPSQLGARVFKQAMSEARDLDAGHERYARELAHVAGVKAQSREIGEARALAQYRAGLRRLRAGKLPPRVVR